MIGDAKDRISASAKSLEDATSALGNAQSALEDAIGMLTSTIDGTSHGKVKEALAQCVDGKDKLDDVMGLVAAGRATVEDYGKSI